ncbi:hypothetical protein QFZ77_005152 [Paenibacillus sp. V4I3]|nr:hypothetical protein [Paenibacillus sp. V4I3]MDQ0887473.1 hypothetical protein [Paenibacillus sp. V4I9]
MIQFFINLPIRCRYSSSAALKLLLKQKNWGLALRKALSLLSHEAITQSGRRYNFMKQFNENPWYENGTRKQLTL